MFLVDFYFLFWSAVLVVVVIGILLYFENKILYIIAIILMVLFVSLIFATYTVDFFETSACIETKVRDEEIKLYNENYNSKFFVFNTIVVNGKEFYATNIKKDGMLLRYYIPVENTYKFIVNSKSKIGILHRTYCKKICKTFWFRVEKEFECKKRISEIPLNLGLNDNSFD